MVKVGDDKSKWVKIEGSKKGLCDVIVLIIAKFTCSHA